MKLIDLLVPIAIGVGTYVVKDIVAREKTGYVKRKRREKLLEPTVDVKFYVEPYSEEEQKFLDFLDKNRNKISDMRVQLPEVFGTNKNVYLFEILPEDLPILNEFKGIKFV